jgi:hypothetical protein
MTGCGALSAVSGILDSNHGRQRRNGPRCPPQVPPPSAPAARWPRRADTDRTARLPGRNRPGRGVRPPVHSPGCWTPRRRVRPSAAIADGRCAARIRTPDRRCGRCVGHPLSAARPADRSVSTGTTTSAADVTVEAAAEGPQRFRPGGGNGTGCRTPTSRSHPPWTPRPPAGRRGRTPDRTPEAADGQSARSFRLVTTSSTLPQGRPRAGNDTTVVVEPAPLPIWAIPPTAGRHSAVTATGSEPTATHPGRTAANHLRRQRPMLSPGQPADWPGRRGSPATASYSLRRACWMLASMSSERWGRSWTAGAGSAGGASHAPGW